MTCSTVEFITVYLMRFCIRCKLRYWPSLDFFPWTVVAVFTLCRHCFKLGWSPRCVDCHLDTREGTHVEIDDFHLAIGADGKIKPFMNMTATYDNATHTGYGAWFPHTITDKAKECADCHENPEVLLSEGLEGDILGEGGSFIPQETVDKVLEVEMPAAPAETPTETPPATPTPPGFELIFAVIAIAVVVLLAKRRH